MQVRKNFNLRTPIVLTVVVAVTVTVFYWSGRLLTSERIVYGIGLRDVYLPSGKPVKSVSFTFSGDYLLFATFFIGSNTDTDDLPFWAEEYSDDYFFAPYPGKTQVLVGDAEALWFQTTVLYDSHQKQRIFGLGEFVDGIESKAIAEHLVQELTKSGEL